MDKRNSIKNDFFVLLFWKMGFSRTQFILASLFCLILCGSLGWGISYITGYWFSGVSFGIISILFLSMIFMETTYRSFRIGWNGGENHISSIILPRIEDMSSRLKETQERMTKTFQRDESLMENLVGELEVAHDEVYKLKGMNNEQIKKSFILSTQIGGRPTSPNYDKAALSIRNGATIQEAYSQWLVDEGGIMDSFEERAKFRQAMKRRGVKGQ